MLQYVHSIDINFEYVYFMAVIHVCMLLPTWIHGTPTEHHIITHNFQSERDLRVRTYNHITSLLIAY